MTDTTLNIVSWGETPVVLGNWAIDNLALRMLAEPVNANLPTATELSG